MNDYTVVYIGERTPWPSCVVVQRVVVTGDKGSEWRRYDMRDHDVNNLVDCVRDLEDENAKLRWLVRDLWLQLLNAYDRKELDEFAERMRELGIEVDG